MLAVMLLEARSRLQSIAARCKARGDNELAAKVDAIVVACDELYGLLMSAERTGGRE